MSAGEEDALSELVDAVMGALHDSLVSDALAGANQILDLALSNVNQSVLELHAMRDNDEMISETQLWTSMVDVISRADPNTNIAVLAAAIVRMHYAELKKGAPRA